ncbi:hypothetical protein [Nocardia yamanashiensis]|uniref:hypothetical protein n=1 Tax=Nocardia yamanashiensis TaxID=209247 RepID=UPI0008360B47|nr:hypothetical protein [Nocardia yamanashiensis]
MAHELDAVIARFDVLSDLARERLLPVVALERGFGLVPLVATVIKKLAAELVLPDRGRAVVQIHELHPLFQKWSGAGPIVYASNDVHAGFGSQSAMIWQDQRVVFSQTGYPYSGPISMALLRLGVTGGILGCDEFDILGLARHRSTAGWLNDATPGGQRAGSHDDRAR